MNPEITDTGSKVSEQPEQTPSSYAHPPFQQADASSTTGHRVPEDIAISPNETQRTTPVDTVDSAAADLLKSAVEDGPGEDRPLVETKVCISNLYSSQIHMSTKLTAGHQVQDVQYEGLDRQLLEEEKKTGDLRRRSKQAVLHLTFTEIRITQMEEQIRKLQTELHNKPDDFQLSVARRQAPTYKSFIKRSSHGEFLLTPQSLEIPSRDQASLEVLVAEHDTPATLCPDGDIDSNPTSICQRTHQQTPERLRIRYAPLIKTLEKVCRESLSSFNFWRIRPGDRDRSGCAATILLRPWKLLVAYEKEIRDSTHNIDDFVEPAGRENVSCGVAEMQVVDDCE